MKLISALAVVFLLFCSQAFSSPYRGGGSPIPAQAAAAGYKTNTFSIRNNFNTSTVDTHCTLASGFLAYNNNLNYGTCDYVGSGTVLNADGSAYVPTNSTMSSISRLTSPPYYVGNAFGGGGYFEAELFFNPAWAGPTNWPAWWLMSAEKLAADFGDQWPGQVTGYNHFMEVDTMEFFAGSSRSYNSTLIDWWGLYNTTCSKYCSLSTNSYPASKITAVQKAISARVMRLCSNKDAK